MTDTYRIYRPWFYAAAIYNAGWGAFVSIFPAQLFKWIGMAAPAPIAMFQVVGMMVGVYAYGYYLLARDPKRYCGLIWVGLAGKMLGPIGFIWAASRGELPWSFGWINVTNDLIWLPAFWIFALKYARRPLDN
jgi:small multidrug resistance pump